MGDTKRNSTQPIGESSVDDQHGPDAPEGTQPGTEAPSAAEVHEDPEQFQPQPDNPPS